MKPDESLMQCSSRTAWATKYVKRLLSLCNFCSSDSRRESTHNNCFHAFVLGRYVRRAVSFLPRSLQLRAIHPWQPPITSWVGLSRAGTGNLCPCRVPPLLHVPEAAAAWSWSWPPNHLHSSTVKGKAIPLQAWTGPVGSRRLKLPHFGTWRW